MSNNKKSIEEIYQKKTQLEHILLRPDSYIGSIEATHQQMWVWDSENSRMQFREIQYVPGFYKIFDEILVNAADNKVPIHLLSIFRCLPTAYNNDSYMK
jgi:DNA topoisomerase II